jgi:hypothetical protein
VLILFKKKRVTCKYPYSQRRPHQSRPEQVTPPYV